MGRILLFIHMLTKKLGTHVAPIPHPGEHIHAVVSEVRDIAHYEPYRFYPVHLLTAVHSLGKSSDIRVQISQYIIYVKVQLAYLHRARFFIDDDGGKLDDFAFVSVLQRSRIGAALELLKERAILLGDCGPVVHDDPVDALAAGGCS